jgi:hypothetical protein
MRNKNKIYKAIFFILVLGYLIPIWGLKYFPSQDGPMHVANAKYLLELYSSKNSSVNNYYQINYDPIANWPSHIALGILSIFLSPGDSERLLLTTYVIIFIFLSKHFLSTLGDPFPTAFLIFPLVYNYNLNMGFYNFSLSICLYAYFLGILQKKLNFKYAYLYWMNISLIFFIISIFHIFVSLFCVIAMSIIWASNEFRDMRYVEKLIAERLKGAVKCLIKGTTYACLIALPSSVLIIPYLFKNNSIDFDIRPSSIFILPFQLVSYSYFEIFLWGIYIFIIIVLLKKSERQLFRKSSAFSILVIVSISLYIIAPEAAFGGAILRPRITLIIYIFILAIVSSSKLDRMWEGILGSSCIGIAIIFLFFNVLLMKDASNRIDEFLTIKNWINEKGTISAVHVLPRSSNTDIYRIDYMQHLDASIALDKECVVAMNYQAQAGNFPLHFRKGQNLYESGIKKNYYGSEKLGKNYINKNWENHINYLLITGCNNQNNLFCDDLMESASYLLQYEHLKSTKYNQLFKIKG